DYLPAIFRLDPGENHAQPDACTGGHRREEANPVDPLVQAGRGVLWDDADVHGQRRDHRERQITMRDRAAEGTFPPGPLNIDMDPLRVSSPGYQPNDACL